MKKLSIFGAALGIAAIAGLSAATPADAIQIISTDDVPGNYTGNNSTISWGAVDGATNYEIVMFSTELNNYSLVGSYSGASTSADIKGIIDSYCTQVANCGERYNGSYQFAILATNAKGEYVGHSIDYEAYRTSVSMVESSVTVSVRQYSPGAETYSFTYDTNGGTFPTAPINTDAMKGIIYYTIDDDAVCTDNEEQTLFCIKAPAGKTLDATEINGVRYGKGEPFLANEAITMKLLWKDLDGSEGGSEGSSDSEGSSEGGSQDGTNDKGSSDSTTNPNTLDHSPIITALIMSFFALPAFALIRKNTRR